ncbi:hypothetical protein HanRHA438_Chr02g0056801 [Helianthus annuus]|uniref:Uncharacterized protein n=1 Tax=Helianthus annuus TaxID=4232 RepID=A0A251TFH8_HELAN|nr:hypothetical protein HanRHA438_Chr02g0056801 [Helianthus annuus]
MAITKQKNMAVTSLSSYLCNHFSLPAHPSRSILFTLPTHPSAPVPSSAIR